MPTDPSYTSMGTPTGASKGTPHDTPGSNPAHRRAQYTRRFAATRGQTEQIVERLSVEDRQVQSMPDVSPTKWHLAHVTWFFETFILTPYAAGYDEFDPAYGYLFNSYYEAVGPRHARPDRICTCVQIEGTCATNNSRTCVWANGSLDIKTSPYELSLGTLTQWA